LPGLFGRLGSGSGWRVSECTAATAGAAPPPSAHVTLPTALFLAYGYHGTNLDEVAARAAVSKQTVYKNFADKNRLFTEIVLGIADDVGDRFRDMTRALQETDNFERDLREFARPYITAVIQPQVLQPRRLVIAESNQFPELARMYYRRAPERAVKALAECIEHLAHRGLLQVEDARLAADQLAYLVLAVPLDKAMFCGDEANFRKAELERLADGALTVFLAAYRCP
jgi:TetR/AcrR family transcriptional regulator, mexJK operon transcriptional repressor